MTTNDKIARRTLSPLELANEMSNVSKARRIMGFFRRRIYEIRLLDRCRLIPGRVGVSPVDIDEL